MISDNKKVLERATKIELENFAKINEIVSRQFEEQRLVLNKMPRVSVARRSSAQRRKAGSQSQRIKQSQSVKARLRSFA